MHDPEKSDSGIVATKPTNKAGRPVAEPVEPRPGTKGNADQQSTHRAQSRARVTQALGRVRLAARQRKKEQFTALLHHINVDTLRTAFYALKRKAAPGADGMTWRTSNSGRGSAWTGPPRSLSAATIPPGLHRQGGWKTTAVSDRRPSGQDRPGRDRHGAQCHLRRRLRRLLLRVPTRTRTA